MSAFIVQNSSIDRIVTFLSNHKDSYIRKPFQVLGYHLELEADCERLAFDLFAMNCDAVDDRYGKGKTLYPSYSFFPEAPVSDLMIYKHIRCFLYQCSEGNVPDRALYIAVKELRFHLAEDIVYKLPEYEELPWD
jgi:hypothetical protein